MGNLPEDSHQDGSRSWGLHRSEPVAKHPYRRAKLRQTDQHALLRMAFGKSGLREYSMLIAVPRNKRPNAVFFSLQGLKTGMYYLRTKPAANPIQFTLNKEKLREAQASKSEEEEVKEKNMAAMVCSLENKDDRLMCGS